MRDENAEADSEVPLEETLDAALLSQLKDWAKTGEPSEEGGEDTGAGESADGEPEEDKSESKNGNAPASRKSRAKNRTKPREASRNSVLSQSRIELLKEGIPEDAEHHRDWNFPVESDLFLHAKSVWLNLPRRHRDLKKTHWKNFGRWIALLGLEAAGFPYTRRSSSCSTEGGPVDE